MKNILIIEDDKDIGNSIKAILEDEDYSVVIAINSEEAFKIIKKVNFDLIILDVWLENSKYDGLEILKKIRSTDSIPIIVISGHGNIDMAVQAIKDNIELLEEEDKYNGLSFVCICLYNVIWLT